jgi:hypothetical protein
MKQVWRQALAGIFVLGLCLAGCQGDTQDPGRVRDLTFVWDADALTRVGGRIQMNNPAPPVDTRLLAWTAPGDDGYSGQASEFDVRYFTQTQLDQKGWTPEQALADHFDQAMQLRNEPFPSPAGAVEQWFLPRLDVSEIYFFALVTKDETGRTSKVSNVAGPAQPSQLALPLSTSAGGTEPGLGMAVANAQNLIGNGFTDLAVGSPISDQVLVYAGAATSDLLEKTGAPGLTVKKVKSQLLPLVTLIGNPGEQFGAAVAGVGRVNRGSRPDLAVGAPAADSGAGRVYLFYGDHLPEGNVTASQADVIIYGEAPGDSLGAGLAALGDLNKDNFADFAVAAPGAGKVYVFLGGNDNSTRGPLPSGKTAAEVAAVILAGDTAEKFGTALASAGDLNGDGYQDFVVGAPAAMDPKSFVHGGAVFVFSGGDAGSIQFLTALKTAGSQVLVDLTAGATVDVTIYGATAASGFGTSVASAGDLLKRSVTNTARDLAVGAPGLRQIDVFYGGEDGPLFKPSDHFEPVVGHDGAHHSALLQGDTLGFGASVIGPGDINLDGYDDLAVGLPALEAVRIYFWNEGPAAAFRQLQLSATPGSGFGTALAPAGDLNQDGYADLLIGAPGAGLAYFEF